MGIRKSLRLAAAVAEVEAGLPVPDLGSPWVQNPNHLNALVYADVYGTLAPAPMTRELAMRVPAVARQRHIIAGSIAGLPLRGLNGDELLTEQPRWATRTDGALSPFHRMLWTVDDLIFHGWSLWSREPLLGGLIPDRVERIRFDRWEFDDGGVVLVDDKVVTDRDVILIPGPHEGILQFGATAIQQAADLDQAATKAAKTPAAQIDLHYTGDVPLLDEEIDALIDRWIAARQGARQGVGFTSKFIEARELGVSDGAFLVNARNAAAVDVSRLMSSPASMADATNAGASLTYETTQGRNGELIDYGLSIYMHAIEARLSMDDVSPVGERIAFDTTSLAGAVLPATGPTRED